MFYYGTGILVLTWVPFLSGSQAGGADRVSEEESVKVYDSDKAEQQGVLSAIGSYIGGWLGTNPPLEDSSGKRNSMYHFLLENTQGERWAGPCHLQRCSHARRCKLFC
jgi:hypothetical protein